MTWQYIDWYLRPTAAYHGAKKACEPLHVQYAYDDHSVYVVNSFYEAFEGLNVSATVYNFDLTKPYEKQAAVNVEADGKTKAFIIDWPAGQLSPAHFLKLELRDAAGAFRSANFYWLSTKPDLPGVSGHNLRGVFFTRPKSTADFTALNTLPPVKLDVSHTAETVGKERVFQVTVSNPGPALAFMVRLDITTGEGGTEIGPVYWDENCFTIFPGESRTLRATVPETELQGVTPAIRATGWNVKP
jgi:exo-1,4-beta-D-glucosaminidase